jgi:hypothetical protein
LDEGGGFQIIHSLTVKASGSDYSFFDPITDGGGSINASQSQR